MDDRGRMHLFENAEDLERAQEMRKLEFKKPLVPLTEAEAKEFKAMPRRERKNLMRNKPCPCGSGKKTKKCCWGPQA